MNFLAPQFLYGLLAISIPIIIHLFDFRRAKKIYFSSNRHLRKISEETSSKRNLKHLLVLLARIFFITFLVLAFAQPFIPAEEKELQSRVQIYLDNSYSMSNEVDEDLTGLDKGIGIVNEIVNQYPAGTRFRLLTNDFEPYSNIFRSGEEINEITTELGYSRISRESSQILERLQPEDIDARSLDTYWISDFQSSLYSSILSDSLADTRLVPISYTSTRNVYVDSVYVSTPFFAEKDRIKIFARLVNLGNQQVENLNLKVFINDIQVTTTTISIEPEGFGLAEFDVAFGLENYNSCRISFEDFPVTFDNDFYFVLGKNRKLRVIEITDMPSSIGQVYANSELFDFERFPTSNIDYSQISAADLVIVNQLNSLDNSLSILLGNYIKDLGTLVIIPSPTSDPSTFSELVNLNIQLVDSAAQTELLPPDFGDPFYDGVFAEDNQAIKMPSARPVYFWFNDRNAILKFPGGQPFLSKLARGGDVFLMSSPLNVSYSNFHLHALFVPVMYKIALQGHSESSQLYSTLDNGQFVLPLDSIVNGGLFKLTNGTNEIIPQQRITGNSLIIDLPPTEINPGFYSVEYESNPISILAFNHGKSESDLTQLSREEIFDRFANSSVEIFESSSQNDISQVLYARYQSLSLWKYCIILALMFIVIEVLLFKFMPG